MEKPSVQLKVFFILPFFFSLLSFPAVAQISQTVRGTVSDKLTKETLIGAVVVLIDSTHQKGSVTDADGNFRITGVPLGRQEFAVSYLGYKPQMLSAVVTSGKEVVFNVALEQS